MFDPSWQSCFDAVHRLVPMWTQGASQYQDAL